MKLLAVILGVCSVLSLTQALPVNPTDTVDTGGSGIQIRGLCNITNQYCPHTLGSYCPKCAADGNFLPRQCSGSTGYCWCVNVITGEIIPNSLVPPGHPPPICVNPTDTVYYGESMVIDSSVQIRGLCNLISQECILLIGAQCPQCAVDGNFLPRQCSGSTGYCWCVNVTTGEKIPNSMVPPGHKPPICALPVNPTDTVYYGESMVIDSSVQIRGLCNLISRNCTLINRAQCPQCAADGNFLPRQCSGSTGYCWCVNVITGEMIPNSMVPPGPKPLKCALPVNPTDTVYYGESMPVDSDIQIRDFCNLTNQYCPHALGVYCPQCAADGNFLPKQCFFSTGYCWCVNIITGEMIPYSLVPPGHKPPICGSSSEESSDSSSSDETKEEKDTDSSNSVNPTDTVDTGESMMIDSSVHIRRPCDLKRQQCLHNGGLIGAYCPKCAADGNFLPEQCSGSTGYCWCVNVITGEIIPNSMVPPGHPPPKCGSSSEESSDSSSSEETKEKKDSDSSSSEDSKKHDDN